MTARQAKAQRGRPTDFRPNFGEEILSLMAEGLSLAAAAAELGIHRQRVYDWLDKHPEFADTIALAKGKRQLFLERKLIKAENSQSVTSAIFALKNAAGEDWREKQSVEHTGADGGPIMTADVSDKDRAAALAAFLAKTKGKGA
jgi:hypothetical protein